MEFSRWMTQSSLNGFMAFRFPWLDYEYKEPLDDSSGEGVVHKLRVWVNKLGKAVVTYEHYLAHDVKEKDIEPPEGEPEPTEEELNHQAFLYAISKD